MNFDLRRPCPKCPFRTDVPAYLHGSRAQEIATSLARGADFPCHQTTVDVKDEEGNADRAATSDSQMCAGALIVLEHMEQPNQIMRVAERVGKYDPSRLDMRSPVARSLVEFIDHHAEDEEEQDPCSVCDAGCLAPAGYMEGGSVVRNVDIDPHDMLDCEGCGQPVCTECANEEGLCPDCEEYELESG